MWQKRKEKKNLETFSLKIQKYMIYVYYIYYLRKVNPQKPKMKRNRTYILHIRCYLQSLILICLFLSYSLYPDLKEKPLENLQWSIDPGADLAQYKMDVTVIDTKVSHRFATGQHAP